MCARECVCVYVCMSHRISLSLSLSLSLSVQWRSIFDSETCHEEQQLERERERERQREERMDGEGGGGGLVSAQRTSSDPAVNSLKVKKGKPLLVRCPHFHFTHLPGPHFHLPAS